MKINKNQHENQLKSIFQYSFESFYVFMCLFCSGYKWDNSWLRSHKPSWECDRLEKWQGDYLIINSPASFNQSMPYENQMGLLFEKLDSCVDISMLLTLVLKSIFQKWMSRDQGQKVILFPSIFIFFFSQICWSI